jgi:L-cysteine:1D-myo-inositol 2-amino-2-deoxy-alpha-D-glucopyranoside ligase
MPPDRLVGVVESMPLVADFVDRLRTAGATYELDGDLYFPVRADPRFGAISHLDRADMLALFAERGGDPDRPGKKDSLDCVLWQRARPSEPAWDGAVGPGRPGWHVECAAMALEFLGDGLDVQGGGSDLVFPHHEMSAAQAHVATGTWPFARAYVHAGMVGLDGEKMSKSKGNLVFVSGLRSDRVEAPAVRLGLLADHYRADRDWTPGLLSSAQARLVRWRRAVGAAAGPAALGLLAEVRQHLANDLDTPAAVVAVDRWADETLTLGGSDGAAPGLVRDMVDALLGVDLDPR